jgi:MFS family permease
MVGDTMKRLTILAPLQHRPFRFLFTGQVISDLGDWLDVIALFTLIVYRWNLGASALAILSVALALPWAIIAPLAGVWADRWPRKAVMIGADLLRAVIVLGLVWAPNFYTVIAIVFMKGVVSTFFSPARQSTIRSIVAEENLLAASSLSQLSVQAAKVIGPAIGGFIVAASSPRTAFAVDSLSYLVSAAFLSRLPSLAPIASTSRAERSSFRADLREGLVYIFQRRALAVAVASMSAALFIIFTFDSLSVLALKDLGIGESLVGLAVGSIGLGTVVGAIMIGQWGKSLPAFKIMGIGKVIVGTMVGGIGGAVILSFSGTGISWILVWMVIGLGASAIIVPYSYILQVETPPELVGRVFATANGVQTVFQLLAPPLGALIAEFLGVGFVFATAGAALAVLGLAVLLIHPKVKAEPPLSTSTV